MQEEPGQSASPPAELLNPASWLVHGLEWPGGEMAEAALAVAPAVIPRDGLSYSAQQILGSADVFASKRGARVIFFTDLTRLLTRAGESWANLGVDWEAGLRELGSGQFPAIYLTISERAYLTMCGPSASADELELVRHAFAAQLEADWPPFIQAAFRAGRIREGC